MGSGPLTTSFDPDQDCSGDLGEPEFVRAALLDPAEAAGFAEFKHFIRNAIGTLKPKHDDFGQRVLDRKGAPVLESPNEACLRRWREAPESTRRYFCDLARDIAAGRNSSRARS